jgi:CDP-diacylglycerol--glycerol-3-phosphate 3-phosphatidyltransferase
VTENHHHRPVVADNRSGLEAHAGKGFLTASNLLSISRALLTIPFVLVMLSAAPWKDAAGVALLVVAAATDKIDGVLARKYGEITEWGKVLDPLADKISIAALGVVLLLLDRIPLWYLLVVLARDLLILAAGVYLKSARGIVLSSNQPGKWAVGIVSLAMFLALVRIGSPWLESAMVGSLFLLGISLFQYTRRFIGVMQR